jgi:protein-disulfide isomerase
MACVSYIAIFRFAVPIPTPNTQRNSPRPHPTAGKFWDMHDMLYENQSALLDRDLIHYAQRLGLADHLIESARSSQLAARVQRDFSSGVRSGVNGSPCLFLNGTRYDGGGSKPTH